MCNKAISADLVHKAETESPDVVKQKEEDTGLSTEEPDNFSEMWQLMCYSTPLSVHFLSYKMEILTRNTLSNCDD